MTVAENVQMVLLSRARRLFGLWRPAAAQFREPALALLERGAVFGEMGFLGRPRRSADVIAVTSMQVLVLTQTFLNRSIRHQPDAAALLLRNLSMVLAERLSQTTDRLWQLSQSS